MTHRSVAVPTALVVAAALAVLALIAATSAAPPAGAAAKPACKAAHQLVLSRQGVTCKQAKTLVAKAIEEDKLRVCKGRATLENGWTIRGTSRNDGDTAATSFKKGKKSFMVTSGDSC